jgi:aminopeptidase N
LKKAIELAPDFEKAKKNVEIVQRRLKEALDEQKKEQEENNQNKQDEPEMSEDAKQALARALQFCKEGKYAPAKELLEKVVAEDATAGKLQGYIQRIDDVIEIKAGRKPKSKIDASNADNDLEVI